MRSNQGTCINQRPDCQRRASGCKRARSSQTARLPSNGEISLGKNALIGFMTWEGYNYEDAVLINEKIVRDDVYTSIHIEEYEIEARDTKLGPEEITRDIPNVGEDAAEGPGRTRHYPRRRRSACRRYPGRQGYARRAKRS